MGPWDALESGRSRNRAVIAECSLASGESRRFHSGTVAAITQILNEINYEMVRQLAEGGMGVVYEAHQLGAGRPRFGSRHVGPPQQRNEHAGAQRGHVLLGDRVERPAAEGGQDAAAQVGLDVAGAARQSIRFHSRGRYL